MLRPGQHQEAVEQLVDPVEFGAQPPGQGNGLRGHRFRLGHRHVHAGPHGGQRRAQLVRRVRDETPLRGERALQPLQQAVDGVGEILQLVLGAGHGQPLMQVVLGDPLGGRRHLPQRAQHPARDNPAEHERHDGHDAQRDGRPDQERVRYGRMQMRGLGRRPRAALRGGVSAGYLRDGRTHAAGDRQQHGAGQQEQRAVQDGQPQPHAAARQHPAAGPPRPRRRHRRLLRAHHRLPRGPHPPPGPRLAR